MCCQGEWVVSGWGWQGAKCQNTGLCCYDGCRKEYSEVIAKRSCPRTPPLQLSAPLKGVGGAFKERKATIQHLRENGGKKKQETEEQKGHRAGKECSEMSCWWSGLVMRQLRNLKCYTGKTGKGEEKEGMQFCVCVCVYMCVGGCWNQYFCDVATQATANDSKHHEKIWE